MPNSAMSKTVIATLAALLVATACDNSTDPHFEGPPPLPDLKTMTADLSFFGESPVGAASNFTAAKTVAAPAVASTTAFMPLAVAAYEAAEDATPVEQNDGYHWTFSATHQNQTINANLTGRARGIIDAVWELRVDAASLTPPLTGFLLLSGRSDLDETNGEWRVFNAATPSASNALLDITWESIGAASWRVVFLNVATASPGLGDYLDYQALGDVRTLSYRDASAGSTAVIQWNSVTKAGSISVPGINGGNAACWNGAMQNVVCLN
jgi:hypothetical protein